MSGAPVDLSAIARARLSIYVRAETAVDNELADALIAVEAAVDSLVAFVSNIATPRSEPLNTAVGHRRLDVRRHHMAELRAKARELLDRVGAP
jgi:hypothetical protein